MIRTLDSDTLAVIRDFARQAGIRSFEALRLLVMLEEIGFNPATLDD